MKKTKFPPAFGQLCKTKRTIIFKVKKEKYRTCQKLEENSEVETNILFSLHKKEID